MGISALLPKAYTNASLHIRIKAPYFLYIRKQAQTPNLENSLFPCDEMRPDATLFIFFYFSFHVSNMPHETHCRIIQMQNKLYHSNTKGDKMLVSSLCWRYCCNHVAIPRTQNVERYQCICLYVFFPFAVVCHGDVRFHR